MRVCVQFFVSYPLKNDLRCGFGVKWVLLAVSSSSPDLTVCIAVTVWLSFRVSSISLIHSFY